MHKYTFCEDLKVPEQDKLQFQTPKPKYPYPTNFT